MRPRPPAPRPVPLLILLLPLLLLPGCGRPAREVSERQRAACRGEAESAATPEEALRRNADCLAAALREPPTSPAPVRPAPVATAPPAPAPIDRYRYCRVHQEEVQAASARLTNAAKPWMVAQKHSDHGSEAYRDAQQGYDAAVAELERLLPPEIRNGMDLLPTATEAYSRCDRQVLEGTSGP
ncbi:hypothetical protein KBZ08_13985 [Cyanobium sp. Candia 9D4]|uniref:hypothetical protein n=1 Tax=Cyanobium sp. Candia 9D4 TaxID=2823707 RepID=UPI0020CE84A1|nr:hypothetical protein [Cyanobium sp. Candia 9D4]MCP9935020.1 hypothetical protein [Cyanobium sp. Candia 9D4]